jgi:hypothetical protein
MIDLAAIATRDTVRSERNRRMAEVTDTAAADSAEIVERQIAKADPPMSAESFKPSSAAEIAAGTQATIRDDPTRINLARLYVDCKRAVGRWEKLKGADRDERITDSMRLIMRWPAHGSLPTAKHPTASILDLGGKNPELSNGRTVPTFPLKRDWLRIESDGSSARYTSELTRSAWKALHAAVKQAASAPTWKATVLEREIVAVASSEAQADAIDLGLLAREESGLLLDSERLPGALAALLDIDPADLADRLSITLHGARAIIARACPETSRRVLCDRWAMSEDFAKKAISTGSADIRRKYPNPLDLLDALDFAAANLPIALESRADRPNPILALTQAIRARDYLAELPAGRVACGIVAAIEESAAILRRRSFYAPQQVACTLSAPTRSPKLPTEVLAKLATDREELARLLDAGNANADRIRTLRANIVKYRDASGGSTA